MKDHGLRQEYDRYTTEDQQVWQILYRRQMEVLPGRAAQAYFDGIEHIRFQADKIPNFSEVNQLLEARTGWGIAVVPGLIDNQPFFEFLSNKRFPATTWLRTMAQLDYLEEPDMFHDVFAHVPLLSNPDFCMFLTRLSEIALKHINNEWAVELISRLYWYTVEFGLIQDESGLRIYGAGILSSSGESVYSLSSEQPHRVPFNVEEIMATPYIKDRYQEKYWVISSYKELYDSIPQVEACLERTLAVSGS